MIVEGEGVLFENCALILRYDNVSSASKALKSAESSIRQKS